jgi:hypothetical protein
VRQRLDVLLRKKLNVGEQKKRPLDSAQKKRRVNVRQKKPQG